MIEVVALCLLLFGQKSQSGDWAKTAAQCANSNENISPADVESYMQQTSKAILTAERIFLVLAGQAIITRGQEISCNLNERSFFL